MTYTDEETCIAIDSVKTVHSSETNNGEDDENQIGAAIRRGMCMAQISRCASIGTYKPSDPCDATTWNEVTLREAQHQGDSGRRGHSSCGSIRRSKESSYNRKMPSFISLGDVQGQEQESDQFLSVKVNHGKRRRPQGEGRSSRCPTTLSRLRHTNGSQHSESRCRPTGAHKNRSAINLPSHADRKGQVEGRHQTAHGQRSLSRVMNKKQERAREMAQERTCSLPDNLPLCSSLSSLDHDRSETQGRIMLNSERLRTPLFSKSSSTSSIPSSILRPDSQHPARLSRSSSALDDYDDEPDSLKALQKMNKSSSHSSRRTPSSISLGTAQGQGKESDQSIPVKVNHVNRGRNRHPQGEGRSSRRPTTPSPPRNTDGRSQHSESKCRPTGTHKNRSVINFPSHADRKGQVEGRHQTAHGQRSLSRVMEDLNKKQERAREMAQERTCSLPDDLPLCSSLSNLDHDRSEKLHTRRMHDGSKFAHLLDAKDQEQNFPETCVVEASIHKSSSRNNVLLFPAEVVEDKRFAEGCSPRTTSFVLDDIFLMDCGTQQDVQSGKGLSPSEAIALLMKPPTYT